jgi:hypothetical protein
MHRIASHHVTRPRYFTTWAVVHDVFVSHAVLKQCVVLACVVVFSGINARMYLLSKFCRGYAVSLLRGGPSIKRTASRASDRPVEKSVTTDSSSNNNNNNDDAHDQVLTRIHPPVRDILLYGLINNNNNDDAHNQVLTRIHPPVRDILLYGPIGAPGV